MKKLISKGYSGWYSHEEANLLMVRAKREKAHVLSRREADKTFLIVTEEPRMQDPIPWEPYEGSVAHEGEAAKRLAQLLEEKSLARETEEEL